MQETTLSKLVLRYKEYDSSYSYISDVSTNSYDELFISEAYSFEEAKDFDEYELDYVMEIYEQFQEENSNSTIEIVRMKTITYIEDVMDDGEFKEVRQKNALAKLTEDEIKALGLTNIAVYIKTKFHDA